MTGSCRFAASFKRFSNCEIPAPLSCNVNKRGASLCSMPRARSASVCYRRVLLCKERGPLSFDVLQTCCSLSASSFSMASLAPQPYS